MKRNVTAPVSQIMLEGKTGMSAGLGFWQMKGV